MFNTGYFGSGFKDNRTTAEKKKDELGLYTDEVEIAEHIDGDTFKTTTGEKVRLSGVDTFESDLGVLRNINPLKLESQRNEYARAYGKDVKNVTLEDLAAAGTVGKQMAAGLLGKKVRLSRFDTDVYGRTLASVYNEDGTNVSEALNVAGVNAGIGSRFEQKKNVVSLLSEQKRDSLGFVKEAKQPTGYNPDTGEPEIQIEPNGTYSFGQLKGQTEGTLNLLIGTEQARYDAAKHAISQSNGLVNAATGVLTGLGKTVDDTIIQPAIERVIYSGPRDLYQAKEQFNLPDDPEEGVIETTGEMTDEDVALFEGLKQIPPDELTDEHKAFLDSKKGKFLDAVNQNIIDRGTAVGKLKKQQELDAKRVNRVENSKVDARVKRVFEQEGFVPGIIEAAGDIWDYTKRMPESLPMMVALSNVYTTVPAMAGMFSSAQNDNYNEFVSINKRQPNKREKQIIDFGSLLQVAGEKLEASYLLKAGGSPKIIGALAEKFAKLPKSMNFLVGNVGKGLETVIVEGASGATTSFGEELAVKQDLSKVNKTTVFEGMVAEAFGGLGFQAVNSVRQAVSPSNIKQKIKDRKAKSEAALANQTPEEQEAVQARTTALNNIKDNKFTGVINGKPIGSEGHNAKEEITTNLKAVEDTEDGSVEQNKAIATVLANFAYVSELSAIYSSEIGKSIVSEDQIKEVEKLNEYKADVEKLINEKTSQLREAGSSYSDYIEGSDPRLYSIADSDLSQDVTDSIESNKSVDSEAVKLRGEVIEATSELASLGKTVETVSKEISEGGKGFIGLREYLNMANEGKLTDNIKDNFDKFVSYLPAKAKAFSEALDLSKKNNKPYYVTKGMDGLAVSDTKPSEDSWRINDGYSNNLVKETSAGARLGKAISGLTIKAQENFVKGETLKASSSQASEILKLAERYAPKTETKKGETVSGKVKEKEVQRQAKTTEKETVKSRESTSTKDQETTDQLNFDEELPSESSFDNVKETIVKDNQPTNEDIPLPTENPSTVTEQELSQINNDSNTEDTFDSGETYNTKQLKGFIGRNNDRLLVAEDDSGSLADHMEDTLSGKDNISDKIPTENFTGSDIVKYGSEMLDGNKPSELISLGSLFNSMKKVFSNDLNVDIVEQYKKKLLPNISSLLIDGKLPDRVIYAMASAALVWIKANSSATLSNNEHEISMFLYNEWDHPLTSEEFNAMSNIGVWLNSSSQNAGKEILNVLGIKYKKDTAGDVSRQEDLEASLGLMMFDILSLTKFDTGNGKTKQLFIIQENQLYLGEFNEERTLNPRGKSSTTPLRTVVVDRSVSGDKLSKDVIGILESLDGVEKTFTKINGTQVSKENIYTDKPPKDIQDRASGSLSKLPTEVKDLLKKMQNVTWKPITKTLDLFKRLDDSTLNILAGTVDVKRLHDEDIKGAESKNRDIEKDIKLAKDFADKPPASFWFKYKAMSQHRIMIDSNGINALRSKIHRYLVMPGEEFESKINTNNEEQLNVFKLAVTQAFGKGFDKSSIGKSLIAFDDIVNDQKVIDVIDAINSNDTAKINKTLSALGGNFHQLAGVMALAEYDKEIIKGKKKSFKTTLGIETDAVTSGYAIGLTQFIGTSTDLKGNLIKVGLSLDKDPNEYQNNLDAGKDDIYKTISRIAGKVMEGLRNDTVKALWSIHGRMLEDNIVNDLGRKLAKPAFMIRNYEAGLAKSVSGVVDDLVSKIHSTLASIQNEYNDANALERPVVKDKVLSFQKQLNVLAGTNDIILKGNLKKFSLKDHIENIRANATEVYTPAFDQAFTSLIGDVKARKDAVSQAVEGMYFIFREKYDRELDLKRKELGRTALSNSEKRAVAESLVDTHYPIFRTLDSNGTFIDLVSKGKDGSRRIENKIKGEKKTSNIEMQTQGYAAPGAAALVKLIQNIDSIIIRKVMMDYDAISLYDAGYYSLNDVVDATDDYNKHFIDTAKSHRIVNEILDRFREVTKNAIKDGSITSVNQLIQKEGFGKNKPTIVARGKALASVVDEIENEFKTTIGTLESKYSNQAYFPIKRGSKSNEHLGSISVDDATERIEEISNELALEDDLKARNEELKNIHTDSHLDIDNKHSKHLDTIMSDLVLKSMNVVRGVRLTLNQTNKIARGWVNNRLDSVTINIPNTKPLTHSEQTVQEVFVHELVHIVGAKALDLDSRYRSKVQRLYDSIKNNIDWSDFLHKDTNGDVIYLTDKQSEIASAKLLYKQVFGGERNRETYLQEFLAYGLTSKHLVANLKNKEAVQFKYFEGKTWFEKLLNAAAMAVETLKDLINNKQTPLSAYAQLLEMTYDVNRINKTTTNTIARNIAKLSRDIGLPKADDLIKNTYKKYGEGGLDKLAELQEQAFAKVKGKSGIFYTPVKVALVTGIIASRSGGTMGAKIRSAESFWGDLGKMRKSLDNKVIRNLYSIYRGFVGTVPIEFGKAISESHMLVEQARSQEKQLYKEVLMNAFESNGENLNEYDRKALNNVSLKTDLSSLVDSYSIEDIISFLSDDKKLLDKIKSERNELGIIDGGYFDKQITQLANRMVSGEAYGGNVYDNANIIVMNAKGQKGESLSVNNQVERIDRLITLTALARTDKTAKKLVSSIGKKELNRDGNNGFKTLLDMHLAFKERSATKGFAGSNNLMRKGYFADIHDPHKEFAVESSDPAQERHMNLLGFKKVKTFELEPGETVPTALYYASNNAMQIRTKGWLSVTSKQKSGTSKKEIFGRKFEDELSTLRKSYAENSDPKIEAKIDALEKRKKSYIESEFNKLKARQASTGNSITRERSLRPIINNNGEVVDYVVDMNHEDKANYLGQNLDVFDVFATMNSQLTDKVNSEHVNKKGIDILYERYKDNYKGNEHNYINILDVNYSDEYFVRLPRDARKQILARAKDGEFYVEEAHMDAIFGYMNWSLGDAFPDTFVAPKRLMRLFEEYVHNVVGVINNNIVVKTPVVFIGNFVSNYLTSTMSGVPAGYVLRYQAEAIKEINILQEDMQKLRTIDIKSEYDPRYKRASVNKRAELVNRINMNPTKELADLGLYTAITTETMGTDEFSYKNKTISRIEEQLSKVDTKGYFSTIVKQLYMAEDTAAYQSMLRAVQVSDFVGRYALYKHMTEEQGKTKDEAYEYIQEMFIDYNIPVNRIIQWANSMGLILFTKYWIRVQKANFGLAKNKPSRVLAHLGLGAILGISPDTIFQSGIVTGGRFTPVIGSPQGMFEQFVMPSGYEILADGVQFGIK